MILMATEQSFKIHLTHIDLKKEDQYMSQIGFTKNNKRRRIIIKKDLEREQSIRESRYLISRLRLRELFVKSVISRK